MTREEIIAPLVRGKKVLDVGSAGEDGSYEFWKFLQSCSGSLTGIDVRPSNESGVVQGNMEEYLFDRTFEVIVAGDVIIQTDNQGKFLDNAWMNLDENGLLILTMPNAKWPTVFFSPSKFQTGWHDRYTIAQLALRHGFKTEKVVYYSGNRKSLPLLRPWLLSRMSMAVICSKISKT